MQIHYRLILALAAILLTLATAQGRQRSQEEVLSLARAGWQQQAGAQSKSLSAQNLRQMKLIPSSKVLSLPSLTADHEAFYLCAPQEAAAGQKGFVMVSADDRMPDVLGYSDEEGFSEDDLPDGLRYVMEEYAEALRRIELGTATADDIFRTTQPKETSTSVTPLMLQIKFNQGSPYNLLCPLRKGSTTTHCATGCVATAMAQVMKYHEWPKGYGTGSVSYDTKATGEDSIRIAYSFDTIQFDWDNITPAYTSTSTDEQKQAVALLMAACGASVKMSYGSSSSASTSTIASAGAKYFGYDADALYLNSTFCGTDTWHRAIQDELLASRPVIIRGEGDDGGGHAFVIDGFYSSTNGYYYYRVNWGWGGSSNGYFLITNLKPSEAGTGGSKTNYAHKNAIITNFQPDDGIAEGPVFGLAKDTLDRTWAMAGQTVNIKIDNLQKLRGETAAYKCYFYLRDTEGNEYELTSSPVSSSSWKNGIYYYDVKRTFIVPATLPLGTYTLVAHPRLSEVPNCVYYSDENATLRIVEEDPIYEDLGILRYNFYDDLTAEVRAYSIITAKTAARYVGDITIPLKIRFNSKNYTITSVHDSAFYGCTDLTSIQFCKNITLVGANAFNGCTSLKEVKFSPAVERINNYAFNGCTSLTGITLPDSLTVIGNYAFAGCTSITEINWPQNLTSIGTQGFSGCTGLKSLSLPATLNKVTASAFINCTGLDTLTIPASVTNIATKAFMGCTGLKGIRMLGETPPTISSKVFDNTNDCPIYVPKGTAATYKTASTNWKGYADRIVEDDVTAIHALPARTSQQPTVIRDLQGRAVSPSQMQKGQVYVIDGRKVIMR